MKTSPTRSQADLTDTARHELCSQFAQSLRGGALQVRVRLHPQTGEAWFYEHRNNQWHKRDAVIRDANLFASVADQLTLLGSKPQGDAVKITLHSAADWQDTDLTFHRDAVAEHLVKNLESHLLSLLFRDHRDSGQDYRRHIQTGPRHTGRSH